MELNLIEREFPSCTIRCLLTLSCAVLSQIKQCKEYISELVLHAEAQASQYQHKVKCHIGRLRFPSPHFLRLSLPLTLVYVTPSFKCCLVAENLACEIGIDLIELSSPTLLDETVMFYYEPAPKFLSPL